MTSQLVVSGPMERYSHVLRIHAVNMNDANELNWWAGKWDHRHRRRAQVRLDVVVDDFGEKIMLWCVVHRLQAREPMSFRRRLRYLETRDHAFLDKFKPV